MKQTKELKEEVKVDWSIFFHNIQVVHGDNVLVLLRMNKNRIELVCATADLESHGHLIEYKNQSYIR